MVVHPTVHQELARARHLELELRATHRAPLSPGRRRPVRGRATDRLRPLVFRLAGIPAPVAGPGTC